MTDTSVRQSRGNRSRVTLAAVQEIDDEFDVRHVEPSTITSKSSAKPTQAKIHAMGVENVLVHPNESISSRSRNSALQDRTSLVESANRRGLRKGLAVRQSTVVSQRDASGSSETSDAESTDRANRASGLDDKASLPSLYALTRRTKSASRKKKNKELGYPLPPLPRAERTQTATSTSKAPSRGILRKAAESKTAESEAIDSISDLEATVKPKKKKGVHWRGDVDTSDPVLSEREGSLPPRNEIVSYTEDTQDDQADDDRTAMQVRNIVLNRQQRLRAALAAATRARRQFMAAGKVATPQGLRLGRPSVRTNFEDEIRLAPAQGTISEKQARALQKAQARALKRQKRESKRRLRQLMQRGTKKKRSGRDMSVSDVSGASGSESDTGNLDSDTGLQGLDDEFESGTDTTTETDTETDLDSQFTPSDSEMDTEGGYTSESDAEMNQPPGPRQVSEVKATLARTSRSLFSPGYHRSSPTALEEPLSPLRNIAEDVSTPEQDQPSYSSSRRLSRSQRTPIGQTKEAHRLVSGRLRSTDASIPDPRKRLFAEDAINRHKPTVDSDSEPTPTVSLLSYQTARVLGVPQTRSEWKATSHDTAMEDGATWAKTRKQSLGLRRTHQPIRQRTLASADESSETDSSTPQRSRVGGAAKTGSSPSMRTTMTPATETASLLSSLELKSDTQAVLKRSPSRAKVRAALFPEPSTVLGTLKPQSPKSTTESRTLMEDLRVSAGLRARGQRSRKSILESARATTTSAATATATRQSSPSSRRSSRLLENNASKAEQEAGLNRHLLGLAGDFGLDTSYLRSLQDQTRSGDEASEALNASFASIPSPKPERDNTRRQQQSRGDFKSVLSSDSDMGELSDADDRQAQRIFQEMADDADQLSSSDHDTPITSRAQNARSVVTRAQLMRTSVLPQRKPTTATTLEFSSSSDTEDLPRVEVVRRTKRPPLSHASRKPTSTRQGRSRAADASSGATSTAAGVQLKDQKLSDGLLINDYQSYYDKIDELDMGEIFAVE